MEAVKEYRVGNYIMDYDCDADIFQIEEIKKNEQGNLAVYYRNGSISSTDPEPIPLTEKWLIDFGFENIMPSQFQLDFGYNFRININVANDKICWLNNREMPKTKYVHQLQNLCFAVTQKELTLSPKAIK